MNLFDERIRALEALGKRVRAMMWSSPTCNTGTMLSIADLMGVVKAHGLISIVDGAHLPGTTRATSTCWSMPCGISRARSDDPGA
ncbi:hypothetical protein C8240_04680 [Paracidovorax cattleyae]|nr:hypothetical protein C8240_04680 [Paracidovorax cattleyae]